MRKLTVYSVLLSIMIVSSVWLHNFPHAYAVTNYAPGVKAGDEITYGKVSVNNTTPYPPFQGNVSSLAIHVKSVDSLTNTVNAVQVTTYVNGSMTNATLTGTTDTGQGNLFPWLLAGGLTAGESVFKNPSYLGFSVNQTVNRVYAGALRTVNVLNISIQSTYQTSKLALYWDAKTGLLVEAYENANYTSPSGPTIIQVYSKATATNVWTPDTNPDFSFDASAQTHSPHLGETASYRLDLASLNRFNGTIALTPNLLGTLPSHPPSVAISSTTLVVSSSNPLATSVLTFSSNASTALGTYLISVNATSGTIEHDTIIAVTIAPPDFTIDANPANLTLSEGTSKTSTITVASRGLFTGNVALQFQFYGGSITPTIAPPLVTLNSTVTKATALLQITANSAVPPSVTNVYINGVSGSISRSTQVLVNVTGPDFRITATPSFLTFKEGQSASSTITLTSVLGFAGTITLSSQPYPPVTASLGRSALNLTAGGSINTTLTVSTPSTGPPGIYSVYVSASSANNIFHYAYVNLNVTGPDFRFRSSNYFITLQTGQTGNATLTLYAVGGFSGTISVTTNSQSTSFTASVTPSSVVLNSTRLSSTALLVLAVPKGVTPGYYNLQLTATSGNLVRTLYLTVQIIGPDFSLFFNPGFLTVSPGGSGTSRLSLSSVDNFTGSVSLTATTPFGFQISISPSSVALSLGGTANSTLTVAVPLGTSPGYYYLNVIGTSGQIQHSFFLRVQVVAPDFSILSSPSFLTLRQGESANSTISLTSFDNFKAPVTITTTTYSGNRVSVSPIVMTLLPVANGTVTTVLTFSASITTQPGGSYFQVTATGGNLTRSTYVRVSVIGPDFSLSVFPFSIGLKPGESTTATVSLTSVDGFNGNVTLSTVSNLNATLNNRLVRLVANGTATTTLTVQVPKNYPGGYYSVTVNATSGFITHTYFVSVQVITPDFALQANPVSLQIRPGLTSASTITITSLNGFNGTVTLSLFQFGSSPGINSTLSESNVTLTSGTSVSVTLNVAVSSSAPSQSFYLNIQGTHGNLTRYTYVFLSVTAPDFSLSFNPPFTLVLNPGGTAQSTVTLTSLNGFNGTVTLSTIGFFSGVNATLSSRNVTLGGGGSTTVTVNISVSPSASSLSFYLTVEAASGNLSRFSSIFVIVTTPDFSLSFTPSSLSIPRGGSSSGTLTIGSQGGFSGNVNLTAFTLGPGFNSTANSKFPVTLSPSIVSVASGGTATSNVTITVPASTVPGFYPVAIQATSGNIVRNFIVQVQVTGTSFSLSPVLSFLQLNAGTIGDDSVIVTALSGFSGQVHLSASSSPAGLNVTMSPATVTLNSSVISTTAFLTVKVPAHPVAGSYLVTVTGSGGGLNVTSFVNVLVSAVDFSLDLQPGSPTVFQGGSSTSTVTISSLNGLNGSVNLRALLLQPTLGISVSLGSGVLFVQNNQTASTSLTVSASSTAPVGNYTVVLVGTFNASSGTPIRHSLNVTLTIAPKPDFSLSISPSSLTVQAGSSGSTILTVTSLNGFTGPVELIPTISAAGVVAAPSVSMVSLSAGGTAVVNFTVSANVTTTPGTYAIALFASSFNGSPLSHSTTMSVTVTLPPDFALTTNTSGLIIASGSSATSTVSISPIRGFTGPVSLLYNAPAGISGSFSPNPVHGGSGFSTLTISVASSVPAGNYTFTVLGSGGSSAHTVAIPIIVSSTSITSLAESRVSWAHRLSLSKTSGVETWTLTVKNTGQSPSYVQLVISGSAPSSNQTFTVKTPVTLLKPGASLTITLSQQFNSASIGLRYSFAINLLYGSAIDTSANIIKPTTIPVTKGTFSIVA